MQAVKQKRLVFLQTLHIYFIIFKILCYVSFILLHCFLSGLGLRC